MKGVDLAEIAKKYCNNVIVCDDANSAISMVKEKMSDDDILFVVGSLYLAGEVRINLIENFKNID